MQINLNVPKFPTVNELATRAAYPPAPRISRKSNSFVSLLERVFSVNQIDEDPLPSPDEVAQVEEGMLRYINAVSTLFISFMSRPCPFSSTPTFKN